MALQAASALTSRVADDSVPRCPQVHLVEGAPATQLLVVNGSRLYELQPELVNQFRAALATGDNVGLAELLRETQLDAAPTINDTPVVPMLPRAISLAVAQRCNLGCVYCYAQQGTFGGAARNMSAETACRAIDFLLEGALPGAKANVSFLGGEPLHNRAVIREATDYGATKAAELGIQLGFSITTNGTLLRPDDAEFFENFGFAVTISLDGLGPQHDRLRPFKSGKGSFEQIMARIAPLLGKQRHMQVSARVTVTQFNLNLQEILDLFVNLGFHSVGFSPLLHAPGGRGELDKGHLSDMLQEMIACGLMFEQHVLLGERYPFLNMVTALRELDRGSHRPYPCGAGVGYFGVSVDAELSACHRFVGDKQGQFGSLDSGLNGDLQIVWLKQRHVHAQHPCCTCWARYLCGGGCHYEVLSHGRGACDFIRGWLHYAIQAYGRLTKLAPYWFSSSVHVPGKTVEVCR